MMDEEKARELVAATMSVSREVVLIFQSVAEEEKDLKQELASVIYRLMEDIVVPVLAEYPNLKTEFEDRRDKSPPG